MDAPNEEDESSAEGGEDVCEVSELVPVRLPKKDRRAFGAAAVAAATPLAVFAANERTLEERRDPLWPLPRPIFSAPPPGSFFLTALPPIALPSFCKAARKA